MDWIAGAALLIGFGSLWLHWRTHRWQKLRQETKIEITRIYLAKGLRSELIDGPGPSGCVTTMFNPIGPQELRVEIVNPPGYPEVYIRMVEVVAPDEQPITMEVEPYEAGRHRGQPAPRRALHPGDHRIYCRSVHDMRAFVRQEDVHVIVQSNLGELARSEVTQDVWEGIEPD